ncbi:hypothetical protein V6N13_043831 [Hibiscus sabdariffa]
MYQENKRHEDYVSNWYNKEKYLAAYNHVLQPVRGKKFWPKTSDPIQPPLVRTLPGRPKKRKKDKDEPTKGKTNPVKQRHCANCRQPGHNKLSCPTKMSQGTTQNLASSTTGPPGMVHGSTQNVASATTGPPGMVHGTTHNIASATTQNIASATTDPPGIVQSTTQNVASTISQSSNQNVASASTVAPTTQPKPIKKTYKKKAQVGIGLYTDMKTGDQIWNPGTSTEVLSQEQAKGKLVRLIHLNSNIIQKVKGCIGREILL